MFSKISAVAAAFMAALPLLAQVAIAPVFSDNMVLQREKNVPVWGTADPGEKVTVSFAGQTVSAAAGSDGKWMVKLAPMPANAKGEVLTVKGAKNSVSVKNILVGEVWLCSGQSNMEMVLRRTVGVNEYVKQASPQIRIIKMQPYTFGDHPKTECPAKWQILDSKNALDFSGAAFHFGLELFKALNVPVGLVSSNWGGTRIEPWTPPCGFDSIPELKNTAFHVNSKIPGTKENQIAYKKVTERFHRWLKEFDAAGTSGKPLMPPPKYPDELQSWNSNRQPAVIYNHMIHPWVPFAFRGVIWYQGCSNLNDGKEYFFKMQALLNGWRKIFNDPEMPFYFVQLAPFTYGGDATRLPVIWEAQEKFALNNKNVGMAVINDVGNIKDIHPTDKRTVGVRLSLLALKYTYGKKELKADSPLLDKWEVKNDSFVLEFKNVDKWSAKGDVVNFEIASAYGKWVRANCRIDGRKLIISAPGITAPVQLRYMWKETSEGNLFNEAGLPLGAFRCGNVPGKEEIFRSVAENSSLIYKCNMLGAAPENGSPKKYLTDNSGKFAGKPVKRITYLVELTGKDGSEKWLAVSMDAFTSDVKKIGVPYFSTGTFFSVKVKNLMVRSNVGDLITGNIDEGFIEFFGYNYIRNIRSRLPGASNTRYDFDDNPVQFKIPGYGSMQIHNYKAKQTIFAYNNFRSPLSDIGIGNAPGNDPDWTFSRSSRNYSKAVLQVYAEF